MRNSAKRERSKLVTERNELDGRIHFWTGYNEASRSLEDGANAKKMSHESEQILKMMVKRWREIGLRILELERQ